MSIILIKFMLIIRNFLAKSFQQKKTTRGRTPAGSAALSYGFLAFLIYSHSLPETLT